MTFDNTKESSLCKIRTITSFLTLDRDRQTWSKKIENASDFAQKLALEFNKFGYTVQSIRIVTNAFGEYLDTSTLQNAIKDMEFLSQLTKPSSSGTRVRFAIGEAKSMNEIEMIPILVKKFGDICNICVNVPADNLGVSDSNLSLKCAKVMKEIGKITPRGEGNFNFTVNYNCKPLIPYFPASYHNSSDKDCFALGLESPDLLAKALSNVDKNLPHNELFRQSYNAMHNALQFHIDKILSITNSFNHPNKSHFAGIDTSAAPSKNCTSIVNIYKSLGVDFFGSAGTIEASALLTRVFKSIRNCDLIGFSGLMLAVVEDKGLAEATKHDYFNIQQFLTYSSVCGIGLDTIPIAGDTPDKKICDILQDMGTMAFRLNKPLTARLFPIPNLRKGDLTYFQSDDLCNSAVLDIK